MMRKKGWVVLTMVLGLSLAAGTGFAAEPAPPGPQVIPVSTGSPQVHFDRDVPAVQTAPALEPASEREMKFNRLAQTIPGMETLDPQSGVISDGSLEAAVEAAEKENGPREIRVHESKKSSSFITYNQYFGAGFVGEEIDALGEVIGYNDNESLNNMETREGLLPQDVVYLDIGVTSNVNIGDRLVVFSQDEEVRHPLGWFDRFFDTREVDLTDGDYAGEFSYHVIEPGGTARGQKIDIRGLVEIIELTPEFAKAHVIYSYKQISKGHQVMAIPSERRPMVSTSYVPKHREVRGYILSINGEHLMSGQNSIIFIDKGSEHEIHVGDRLEVFVRPRSVETDYEDIMPHVIGELVVLSVQPETAATLVIKSTQPIFPGHRFRGKIFY